MYNCQQNLFMSPVSSFIDGTFLYHYSEARFVYLFQPQRYPLYLMALSLSDNIIGGQSALAQPPT